MSFITKINALKFRLEENQALQDYFAEKFKKTAGVRKEFRNRAEINLSDLPLILITRPSLRREQAGNVIRKEHSVSLYVGFQHQDRADALEIILELEERIEIAVTTYTSQTGDTPMPVSVEESVNDEGMYHPSYFFMMGLKVKDR